MACYSLEKIHCATWQSNHTVKSKSARLLVFRALFCKDASTPLQLWWSGKSNLNISCAQRIVKNYIAIDGEPFEFAKNGMGTHDCKLEGKCNETAGRDGAQFWRKRTSSFPNIQCVGSRILGERKVVHFSFASTVTRGMQIFYFAQINSANHFSIHGAVADWCDELAHQIPGRSSSSIDKIDRVVTKRNSQICRKHKIDSNLRNSGIHGESCFWTMASGQSTTWMMDFGGKTGACREYTPPPDHDDSEPVGWIRGFTMIGPSHPDQSHVLFWPIWNWSSRKSHVKWLIPLLDYDTQRTKPIRGWSFWTAARLPMTKRWQVVQSIEKSIATKQQEQSSPPVNHAAKTFIPIDQRMWKDILAVSYVKSESLAWRVSKVTRVSRHRGLHREYDGAIDWSSLLLVRRPRFSKMVLGISRIHNGWDLYIEEAARTRFQFCLDSNENLI